MKHLKAVSTKLIFAAVSTVVMSTAAAAQDVSPYTKSTVSYEKTAELHLKAPQTPASKTVKEATPEVISERRVIRKVLPTHYQSVRTVDMGRVFTTRDHAYDAMTVYKPETEIQKNEMPNLYKPNN
ncbi:hypothetical protein [Hellea balneolensis]|uniref:hypothetical protein n=1 Tax=Hellea balneolensis TaxID=287478 RepID=UPI00041237FE|nr:hypothetical protein [Hellea balneolensis]